MLAAFGLTLTSMPSFGFEYGQCLLDRSESFDQSLKDYKNVALAKGAIKKFGLEHNLIQIKWNYDTTSLIYDLIVLKPVLDDFDSIFQFLEKERPEALNKVAEYLSGASGHLALAEVDGPYRPGYQVEDETDKLDLQSLIKYLGEQVSHQEEHLQKVNRLRVAVDSERVKDALGDFYDHIQEASIGSTPLDPRTIGQWIELERFFRSKIIPEKCKNCLEMTGRYKKLLKEWASESHLITPEEFEADVLPRLPALNRVNYPRLSAGSSGVGQQLVDHFYLRSIEDFLFSRNGLTLPLVVAWMRNDPNYKIILKQAQTDEKAKQESTPEAKLFNYVLTQERVLENAFDHFVWRGQEGTDLEKSIDGVARTIYGEAESCQAAGANQFEAIGAVIAARSISVDQENQRRNIFSTIIDYAITTLNKLSPIEIAPLSSYDRGASDFGRIRQSHANPEIIGMTTPAQVVSRPIQFSVWKIGRTQEFEVARWIQWPKDLGYPQDFKTSISAPVGSELDPAQRKVLCPNPVGYKKALEVATQVVNDYYGYANTYRFYQGSKRVVPYFYTHGPKTDLGFVRRLQPMPSFMRVTGTHSDKKGLVFENLPLLGGDINCRSLKLYVPKSFEIASSAYYKKKRQSKARKK
jgi:hypothetical protein